MKKVISTTVLMLTLVAAGWAQSDYDLRFKIKFNKDTLTDGNKYTLIDSIFNDGTDDFPGGTYTFSIAVNKLSKSDVMDADSTFSITIPAIKAGGSGVIFKTGYKVKVGKNGSPDSFNIVIVFPTGDLKDKNPKNNMATTKVFIKSRATSKDPNAGIIAAVAGEQVLSVYPSPASSYFSVQVNSISAGTVNLFDINGRPVMQRVMQKGKNVIRIDLNDDVLIPNGVYFVSFETNAGHEVRRVMVSR